MSPWEFRFNPVEVINVYTLGPAFINYSDISSAVNTCRTLCQGKTVDATAPSHFTLHMHVHTQCSILKKEIFAFILIKCSSYSKNTTSWRAIWIDSPCLHCITWLHCMSKISCWSGIIWDPKRSLVYSYWNQTEGSYINLYLGKCKVHFDDYKQVVLGTKNKNIWKDTLFSL